MILSFFSCTCFLYLSFSVSSDRQSKYLVIQTLIPFSPSDTHTHTHTLFLPSSVQFSSIQSLSRVQLGDPMNRSMRWPPCPSPTPGVHSDSRPSSQWCHPAISSSVVPFSSCPQSLPASESFPMSQLFAWGGQSTTSRQDKIPKQRKPPLSLNLF